MKRHAVDVVSGAFFSISKTWQSQVECGPTVCVPTVPWYEYSIATFHVCTRSGILLYQHQLPPCFPLTWKKTSSKDGHRRPVGTLFEDVPFDAFDSACCRTARMCRALLGRRRISDARFGHVHEAGPRRMRRQQYIPSTRVQCRRVRNVEVQGWRHEHALRHGDERPRQRGQLDLDADPRGQASRPGCSMEPRRRRDLQSVAGHVSSLCGQICG